MFVLKHNESFAILDAAGNIWGKSQDEDKIADGLVRHDTRILSRAVMTLNGKPLEVTESSIDGDNVVFTAKLKADEGIEVTRTVFLWNDSLYEKIEARNAGGKPVDLPLEFSFGADFRDLFELRGRKRAKRGETHEPENKTDGFRYSYTGLDNIDRAARISFSQNVAHDKPDTVVFKLSMPTGGAQTLYVKMGWDDGIGISQDAFFKAEKNARAFMKKELDRRPKITTSNKIFDQWLHQNAVDLALLTTEKDTGPYPYAGIPWYSAAFGRDALITAFQLLWQDPAMAKGVLNYLSKMQADETSAFRDCEPGKILHETRLGETANTQEVPYGPYYGAADATPLFVYLAGAYYQRTGDEKFIKSIWPNIEKALEWIDKQGDKDGDGFVEYLRGAESGLGNQGWKDSKDCISHENGDLAEGAIALCEVQGYVYAAKRGIAEAARVLGKDELGEQLDQQADTLKDKFNKAFWSDKLGTYAIALDGKKKPCLTSTSNPGHLLFSGIVPEDRAAKVAEKLMSPEMFSGWGIRTLASDEKRYEPLKHPEGYHNGTVWVHDTALCAAGFERYHMEDKAAKLLGALFEAAQHFPSMRLPELFGGLARKDKEAPAFYPVACNPQAWASGAESMLVQSMLGIHIDGPAKKVTVEAPRLPAWLDEVTVHDLKIGDSAISLKFQRKGVKVDVIVTAKSDDITCAVSHAPRVMQGHKHKLS